MNATTDPGLASTPRNESPAGTAVAIQVGPVVLEGHLAVPSRPVGVVVLASSSGRGRHSRRSQFVASRLLRGGVATLLIDLLTSGEGRRGDAAGRIRSNIDLLARRLCGTALWLESRPETANRPVGFFGAGSAAAAALLAAARHPDRVAAVSCVGPPDLARNALPAVRAPTLLVVGGGDAAGLEVNAEAYDRLRCAREMAIVPGATDRFVEPGAIEDVARLVWDWFRHHLARAAMAELEPA